MSEPVRGLFITGTDTEVGKTRVTAMIARALVAAGYRPGVYKPAASGCRREGDELVADDAVTLWEAAGRPGTLELVCPQRFEAPIAPHLAARAEGRQIDVELLRHGIDHWRAASDIVLVEGVGGLMSPLSEQDYVADLAAEFGYPLLIVSRNALGTINQTLQTLIAAASFGNGLPVAGIVLNHPVPPTGDASIATNRAELSARCNVPILAEVPWQADRFDVEVDWFALARLAAGFSRRETHSNYNAPGKPGG